MSGSEIVASEKMSHPMMPQNVGDLMNEFDKLGFSKRMTLFNSRKQRETKAFDPPMRQWIQYPCNALRIGRPLNTAMIVMAGETGSGKSSTVNKLFEDHICHTRSTSLDTRPVTEFRKRIKVDDSEYPLQGYISIVDVPGTFDSTKPEEARNFVSLKRLANNHVSLVNRPKDEIPSSFKRMFTVREHVFPNVVLFTFNSVLMNDNYKRLIQCLKVFKGTGLFDKNRANIVFVGTHCLSLGPNERIFVDKTLNLRNRIQNVAFDVLGVTNARIVFTENEPENFNLEKEKDSDYYRLPNGEFTPQNLFRAISDLLQCNEDTFGSLITAYYFQGDIPEKKNKPEVRREAIYLTGVSDDEKKLAQEVHEAEVFMKEMNLACEDPNEDRFVFFNLGRGFCPKSETSKNAVFTSKSAKQRMFNKTFPEITQIVKTREVSQKNISYSSKKEYIRTKKAEYGLDVDILISLNLNVSSGGQYLSRKNTLDNIQIISYLYEIRVARILMQSLSIEQFTDDLRNDFSRLPEELDDTNYPQFSSFLDKWGSHYVYELWLGGSIRVDFKVQSKEVESSVTAKLLNRVKLGFNNLAIGANMDLSSEKDDKLSTYYANSVLHVEGGDPPDGISLTNLTPEMFQRWVESINNNPTEMKDSIKLWPYYSCSIGKSTIGLRDATLKYLENKPEEKRRRMDDAVDSIESSKSAAGERCFPLDSIVVTRSGKKRVSDLMENDEVATISTANDGRISYVYTKFNTFLHIDLETLTEYIELEIDNGMRIRITGSHLIFVISSGKVKAIQSREVRIGDTVVCMSNDVEYDNAVEYDNSVEYDNAVEYDNSTNIGGAIATIVDVRKTILPGMCAPLTEAGTLVVDGVFVSCYADVRSHRIAHMCMAPLRIWMKGRKMTAQLIEVMFSREKLAKSARDQADALVSPRAYAAEIHRYAQFLSEVRKYFAFEI